MNPRKCRTCKRKFYPRRGDALFLSCAGCRVRAKMMTVYRLVLWLASEVKSAVPEKLLRFLNALPYAKEPKEAYEAIRVMNHRRQDARLQTIRRHLRSAYDTRDPALPNNLPGLPREV